MVEDHAEWRQRAACKGPYAELFYPPIAAERKEDKIARERNAKAICVECPVASECLEHALSVREAHGIWGGMNETERRSYAARRAVLIS
jgi:WhiB family redox-sensing transcriptional regulator